MFGFLESTMPRFKPFLHSFNGFLLEFLFPGSPEMQIALCTKNCHKRKTVHGNNINFLFFFYGRSMEGLSFKIRKIILCCILWPVYDIHLCHTLVWTVMTFAHPCIIIYDLVCFSFLYGGQSSYVVFQNTVICFC